MNTPSNLATARKIRPVLFAALAGLLPLTPFACSQAEGEHKEQPAQTSLTVPAWASEEIKQALAWSAVLDLPSVKGLKRVQIVNEWNHAASNYQRTDRLSGWLLEEKDGTSRVFLRPWPHEVKTVKEYDRSSDGSSRSVCRVEKVDCKTEAEAMVEALDTDDGLKFCARFGRALGQRTAVFLMGRDCLELGHAEPGMKLLNKATRLGRDADDTRSLRQSLEEEFALEALLKITLDFKNPAISRETLLKNVEIAQRNFLSQDTAHRMKTMADRLRPMVEEDKAHKASAKPFASMTPDEQAEELVFLLRNQNGRQISEPGSCDVFDTVVDSPAHRLVKMGRPAVPALIKALINESYSRSVGHWRNFAFSHTILTVGDCAEQVLERITGRDFYTSQTSSGYMSSDGLAKTTQEAAEKWWANAQKDGGGGKEP